MTRLSIPPAEIPLQLVQVCSELSVSSIPAETFFLKYQGGLMLTALFGLKCVALRFLTINFFWFEETFY